MGCIRKFKLRKLNFPSNYICCKSIKNKVRNNQRTFSISKSFLLIDFVSRDIVAVMNGKLFIPYWIIFCSERCQNQGQRDLDSLKVIWQNYHWKKVVLVWVSHVGFNSDRIEMFTLSCLIDGEGTFILSFFLFRKFHKHP